MDLGILFVLMMGIACPVIMGLMMWLMFRDMRPTETSGTHGNPADRLAALRKQKHQIESEIAELSLIEQDPEQLSRPYAREEHETAAS